jgi:hypothetical protein
MVSEKRKKEIEEMDRALAASAAFFEREAKEAGFKGWGRLSEVGTEKNKFFREYKERN